MLGDEEKKVDDLDATIGNKEALCNVWNLGKWIMLNAIFHPIYTVVNAMVLGHQENEKMLAGLGLGSLTMGIGALSIGSSFLGATGTFISHAYGQKEYRQCQVYKNRSIFLVTVLYLILLIPLLNIRSIYTAIG